MDPKAKAQMDRDLSSVPFGTAKEEDILKSLAFIASDMERHNKGSYAVAAVLDTSYKPFVQYAKYLGSYKGSKAVYLVLPSVLLANVRQAGGMGFLYTKDGKIEAASGTDKNMWQLAEKISTDIAARANHRRPQVMPKRDDGTTIPTRAVSGRATGPNSPEGVAKSRAANDRAEQALRVNVAKNPIPKPPAAPVIPRAEAIDIMADFITEDIRDSNGIKYQD